MPQRPAASAHVGGVSSGLAGGGRHMTARLSARSEFRSRLVLCALEIRSGLGSASKRPAPWKSAPCLGWHLPGQGRSAESHPPLPSENTELWDALCPIPAPSRGGDAHGAFVHARWPFWWLPPSYPLLWAERAPRFAVHGWVIAWTRRDKIPGQREPRADWPVRPPLLHRDGGDPKGQCPSGPGPPG